jgi:hypothetical protein
MLRSKFTGEDLDKLAQYAKQIGVISEILLALKIFMWNKYRVCHS